MNNTLTSITSALTGLLTTPCVTAVSKTLMQFETLVKPILLEFNPAAINS
ncbi:hypothetical protein GNI_219410, partial [Gregarina niphandrodes]